MSVSAQLEGSGIPFSQNVIAEDDLQLIELLPIDSTDIITAKSQKIAVNSIVREIDIRTANEGKWHKIGDRNVWIVRLKSVDAHSLSFIIENFLFKEGEKLFIFNAKEVLGAYTKASNRKNRKFATRQIKGDNVIIEFSTPYSVAESGTFSITSVLHSFSIEEYASCNINASCIEGDNWKKERRAICRVDVGGRKCTGVLINNTFKDETPYVLTANHCIWNDYEAENAVFTFNYETLACDSLNAYAGHVLSGATVMCGKYENDYTLLKLMDHPPVSFMPYYAGWSLRSDENLDTVTVLHHPDGAPLKISQSVSRPIDSTFKEEGEPAYTNDAFWLVQKYDLGITEGGSSGAPLFDKERMVVGTLTGGDDSNFQCKNDLNDYYQMFNKSFTVQPLTGLPMSNYLNPNNAPVGLLAGFDPLEKNVYGCDTFSNIADTVGRVLHLYPYGNGYLAGHNEDSISQFGEVFENTDSIVLYGAWFHVAKCGTNGNVVVRVFSGSDYTSSAVFEKIIPQNQMVKGKYNYVEFYPGINLTGNYTITYQVEYQSSDTFAVYMSPLIIDAKVSSAMINNDGWQNMSDFLPGHESVSMDISAMYCKEENKTAINKAEISQLKLFPNPAKDWVVVNIEGMTNPELQVVNIYGQLVNISLSRNNSFIKFNVSNLKSGLYLIKVNCRNRLIIGKFMKV
jgi:hypothetical protein